MRLIRKLRLLFRTLFLRSRVENDLTDELRDYIEREVEREIAAGSSPDDARRIVRRAMQGGEQRLKEECRDARGTGWIEDAVKDLRFALRTMRRTPAFTVTVVTALAFCIGANTAIFSVVDTVLFRPLPFPQQDRLVSATEGIPSAGFPIMPYACPDYLFVDANNRSLESM